MLVDDLSRCTAVRRVKRRLFARLVPLMTALACVDGDRRIAGDGSVPEFVGSVRCGECHSQQYVAWRGSQHAAAMQHATDSTVLGDFNDATFTEEGTTSRFFRRDGRFFVNTLGGDGVAHDYEVRFTFGVAPLQQYLVPFPGGRLQPLALAWDTRPSSSGGQRWFALDAVAPLGPADDGHWSGRGLNWNYMCADCHATAVRKGYVASTDSFDTRYSELGVGCEACHGPGAAHARWGSRPSWLRATIWRDTGLVARLDERRGVRWAIDSASGNARRSAPRTSAREIEGCAPCHARRVHIADGYAAGMPLMDAYDPIVLLPTLHHADGQQLDEVYDHASFLQSRMFAFGVTCADCHDPHSQKLRLPGRQVCLQCHRAAAYDTAAHHGHQSTSAGSDCAACHMPAATYLEIDPRHDHSIRIPRPDRTVALGVPNACASCHAAKGAAWAADAVQAWRRRGTGGFQSFAESFDADDRAAADALSRLLAIARDASQPAVVRASALGRLSRYRDPAIAEVVRDAVRDSVALVRRWALEALEGGAVGDRLSIVPPLLSDPRRAVRQKAAWLLAPTVDSLRTPELRAAFARARDEFIASQRYNADRADHRVALGVFLLALGDTAQALGEFRTAATQWPRHLDAVVNLAGVLSLQGKDGEGERVLREALRLLPDEAELHHALGLALARQSRLPEAIAEVQEALRLAPGHAGYERTLGALRALRVAPPGAAR